MVTVPLGILSFSDDMAHWKTTAGAKHFSAAAICDPGSFMAEL